MLLQNRVISVNGLCMLQFDEEGSLGCILFIYSVVLSRTVHR